MTEITDLSPTDSSNTTVTGESIDGAIANMGRMDNTLQAVMGLLARSIRTNVLRFLDNTDPTKKVKLDLSGLPTATERTWTAPPYSGTITMSSDLKRGKVFVVNGDMQSSQENVNNSGTTNGFFGADQWATYRVTSAGVITTQRVAARTPAGGSYRYRVTITTPDASLAAGEYLAITQPLEGSNVQAFLYGTASASASVLRFGFKGPAGTYAARFGNSAANRSFVGLFTISGGQANTDTVQNIAIPGDTTGTWLTDDGVIGITLDIVLACGSTFQGTTGWQAGNILGTSAVSNGMGTGSAVFELFDVGLKLDPDATGVYGQYEVGEVDAVYRSERYLPVFVSTGTSTPVGVCFGINTISALLTLPIYIRPAKQITGVSVSSVSHLSVFNPSATDSVVATAVAFGTAGPDYARISITASTAVSLGAGSAVEFNNVSGKIILTGARLS